MWSVLVCRLGLACVVCIGVLSVDQTSRPCVHTAASPCAWHPKPPRLGPSTPPGKLPNHIILPSCRAPSCRHVPPVATFQPRVAYSDLVHMPAREYRQRALAEMAQVHAAARCRLRLRLCCCALHAGCCAASCWMMAPCCCWLPGLLCWALTCCASKAGSSAGRLPAVL